MEFLSQTYVALRGPSGALQTPADTITRLSDRLSPATLLADRRAAVLALKGLARDCKQDIAARALPGLLEVLFNDAEIDAEIGKAVLEILDILCDTEDASQVDKELAFRNTDRVLADERVAHTLFSLLGDTAFYTRFATLRFLSTLLQNRRQIVQSYLLTAPTGVRSVVSVLEDKREIIRNEANNVVQILISQSPDIQKVLAFEGALDKLFMTVTQEGGVEGGVIVEGALHCINGLLQYNNSNQSYFRETPYPPVLCSLLHFPPNLQEHESAPQDFALQFWDDQKLSNALLIVGIMGMFVGSKNNIDNVFVRCLLEMALASNAPTVLKTQSLRLLPSTAQFSLSNTVVTPYLPVPETNGEDWDRLEPSSALDVLVELALHGEYIGLESGKRTNSALELRAAAAGVFENSVRKEETSQAIVEAMLPSKDEPSMRPLLQALTPSLSTISTPKPSTVMTTHFATLLFSHLLRSSPHSKTLARQIIPPPLHPSVEEETLFIPAEKIPSLPLTAAPVKNEEDEPQSLIQVLVENLSLAFLARSRTNLSLREAREWDRLVVGYLCLLMQWLWDDPKSVRDFLDAGGLSMLMDPINQTTGVDSIIPGLCAFLLGLCYEFNRDPGEQTRTSVKLVINRLGVDMLIGLMARLREDERFKAVGPESMVLPYPTPAFQVNSKKETADEAEIWFDWAFMDFWKSNYYAVQRGLSLEPGQLSSSSSQDAETLMLVSSLRDVIRQQSTEIDDMREKLRATASHEELITNLERQVAELSSQLESAESKRSDVEREQEDLLVLLDELTRKRRRDKVRLREAGLEISDEEADEDEDT